MPAELRFQLGHQFVEAYLSDGDSLADVDAYADGLKVYSNAAINYCSVIFSKVRTDTEDSGDFNNLDLHAKIHLRAQEGGERRMIIIYAPKADMLEQDPAGTYRVKPAIGEELAALYSERLAKKTYLFTGGALCGSTEHLP
jgi:hypothetical protein